MNWAWFTDKLDGMSKLGLSLLGFALLALVATVHYATGYEVSFSVFYLLPIVLVAWYSERWLAFVFCGLCAMVWYLIDNSAGAAYSYWLIPIWNALVRLSFFFMTSFLLSELKQNLHRQEAIARIDGLTGLLNNRAFKETIQNMVHLAARYKHTVALAYLDVDNFKGINDTMGHSVGDQVLKAIAETMMRSVRGTDVVARLGGDEFAVFMPEITDEGAQVAFTNLHESLKKVAEQNHWPIGFSIGVAIFTEAPESIDAALKTADSLMYRVKLSTKNRLVIEQQDSQTPA